LSNVGQRQSNNNVRTFLRHLDDVLYYSFEDKRCKDILPISYVNQRHLKNYE